MVVVGVLGPLQVQGPAGPVPVGSSRQRRLLVALAARAGQVVDTDLLTDMVWPDPPADPAGALQTNVSRLRRILPEGVRIETATGGYRLLAARANLDVTEFTDLLDAAEAAAPTERPELYRRALELWRGRPFAEIDHPSLHPEVARLTELRISATEQRAWALLAVDRVGEAVATLEALVAAEPMREGAVALLMRALIAGGRQGDALAAFARLRGQLADELGIDPSPDLRDLERQVLRQEVAPLSPVAPRGPGARSLVTTARPFEQRHRLRLPVSAFVGRAAELAAIRQALAGSRIVSLCGPGGVGKTRLALHAAAAMADHYDDGVLVAELAQGGPAEVIPAVAAGLRVSADQDQLADRIVDVLAVRRQLLVLDNCEHVADEVAWLAEAIAVGTPGVGLLLTSREPLRVDGERVVRIDPLPPDEAAALLTVRLAAAGEPPPDPALVDALCRRLDGLPLALELAAGRAASLGLRGLLDALVADETLAVLGGGRRTAATRHRSIADVVSWSHALLGDDQRVLFERFAVFAGFVETAAVAAVCGDIKALPDLVERSLVVRRPDQPDRFGMLETLRGFGRARLARDPDAARLRDRHAAWAVRVAAEIARARRGADEPAAVRRFDTHLADLRRGHAWLCERGAVPDALAMGVLFGELAYVRGRVDLLAPVVDALAAARVPPPGGPVAPVHPLVPRLLGLLAAADWQRGDLPAGEARARQSIAVAEVSGTPEAARYGFEALSNVVAFRGDLGASLRYGHRALDMSLVAGDEELRFMALTDLAVFAAYAHDPRARVYEAEFATLPTRAPTARAWREYTLGEVRADRGDPDAAEHLAAAVAAAEEVDSAFIAGLARHTLLTSAARDGDPSAALPAFGALLDHWHGLGALTQVWIAIRALAEALSRLGRHRDAAVLLGALAASPGAPRVYGADAARLVAVDDAARSALGEEFDAAERDGAALGDQGALALARRLARASES